MTKTILAVLFSAGLGAQTRPAKPGLYAVFQTSEGTITARLFEREVPIATRTFVNLAQGTQPWRDAKGNVVKRPFYENMIFHRVLPKLMIQSGDPTGTGAHNCGFTIHDEFLPGLRFDQSGKLAMANTGASDSGGCQFFITTDMMPQWSGKYTIFGQVVSGLEVAEKISKAKVIGDKPVEPAKLIHVSIERVGPVKK
jgi:cyclophilin family peptidyl-prolyl cis-trans isomerase